MDHLILVQLLQDEVEAGAELLEIERAALCDEEHDVFLILHIVHE